MTTGEIVRSTGFSLSQGLKLWPSHLLQVVHHLFPNICHTHYPAIAPIVVDTCREFGVPYKVFPSVRLQPRFLLLVSLFTLSSQCPGLGPGYRPFVGSKES